MEYCGYAGNILYVDLTNNRIQKEPLKRDLVENYMGGWGINFKLAFDLLKPNTDPFSPDNPIILGAGPLVGSSMPGSSKICATTKFSIPATSDGRHYVTSAISGSRRFGKMMKMAGFDHIVITGKAERPVYINISDENIEICEAEYLWGNTDIYATTDSLIQKHGKCGVIAIGRAGENLCRFSMAITDKKSTLGRSGFGAVMGSKNLKAIITAGSKKISIADIEKVNKLKTILKYQFKAQRETAGDLNRNIWRSVVLENMNPGVWSKYDWDRLYGPDKWPGIRKNISCNSCWLACGSDIKIKDGEFSGAESQTGPYLWVGVIGQKLELTEQQATIKFLELMNKEGICAVTTSSMIDWITRRYVQGSISNEKMDGMELKRELNSYLDLAEKIINRDGFGDKLAEGWFEASKWMGKDADTDYLEGSGITKGTDCIYPARAAKLDPMRFTMGISSPRGGHSCMGASIAANPLVPLEYIKMNTAGMCVPKEAMDRIFEPVDYYGSFNVARLTRHIEDYNSTANCLGVCEYWHASQLIDSSMLSEFYSAVTGIDTTPKSLKLVGERTYNLYKLLNVREGFTRSDDSFPKLWLSPLVTPDGIQILTDYYRMHIITEDDINKLLNDYYDERGWDITSGIPTKEKMKQLGLMDESYISLVE
jgi:aldehyde:ferredoxin oxidoreductase